MKKRKGCSLEAAEIADVQADKAKRKRKRSPEAIAARELAARFAARKRGRK